MTAKRTELLAQLDQLTTQELRAWLAKELTQKKLGISWERDAIEHDKALNGNIVLPRQNFKASDLPVGASTGNLVIEGDNFDSLRLLTATHRGKVKAIYIDPPYNTGEKDWVYNDSYVSKNNRWRHSKWLEFIYRRILIAKDLLTPDGVMFVSINDENRARLDMLLEEAMPGRRIGSFVWRSRTGGNDTKGAFLSANHEHVLVYANPGFRFWGEEKSYSMYRYEDSRGVYRRSDLTKAHDRLERPNTYYPIHDPEEDIFYPCNPSRVWAYATRAKVEDGQRIRGKVMEEMIASGDIWFPPDQKVEVFSTKAALIEAIRTGKVPHSNKTPLLTEDMEDLDFWVGKRIGYGRPALKKYKDSLKNETQPLSSWLTPRQEGDTVDVSSNMPIIGTTDEGSKRLRELLGKNAFPYPKPPSLISTLLAQSTSGDDIVLDFFAGSGTTGEAVLRLNQQDGGDRRYILCSSTEATAKRTEHNVCRDVCAERLRAVNEELKLEDGLSRYFAYLTLDLVEEADIDFEGEAEHALALVSLREVRRIRQQSGEDDVFVVADDSSAAILICRRVTEDVLSRLASWPAKRIIVYSPRPDSVRSAIEETRPIESYPLDDAFRRAQGARNTVEEVAE